MTPIHQDRCLHGIETYVCSIYNKDIYLLSSKKVICIRFGSSLNQYISVDISLIKYILHGGDTYCYSLKELVRTIVQQGDRNG